MSMNARRVLIAIAAVGMLAIGVAGGAGTLEARTRVFVGVGLPLFLPLFPPPAYYYPPPAYYGPPPAYHAPPVHYAPRCHPRYDWRWTHYGWQQVYVGCY